MFLTFMTLVETKPKKRSNLFHLFYTKGQLTYYWQRKLSFEMFSSLYQRVILTIKQNKI